MNAADNKHNSLAKSLSMFETSTQKTNRRQPTPFPHTNEVECMPATSLHDLLDSMHNTLSQLQIAAGRAWDVIYSLRSIQVSSPTCIAGDVKARPVPYALRPKIDVELELMEAEGIVTPADWSEWATPVVPVVKQNGTVQICDDFKVTANPQLKFDQYPLPLIDDIFASLAGRQKFSKIDLRSAYTQMEITNESKPMPTLTMHRGLF